MQQKTKPATVKGTDQCVTHQALLSSTLPPNSAIIQLVMPLQGYFLPPYVYPLMLSGWKSVEAILHQSTHINMENITSFLKQMILPLFLLV